MAQNFMNMWQRAICLLVSADGRPHRINKKVKSIKSAKKFNMLFAILSVLLFGLARLLNSQLISLQCYTDANIIYYDTKIEEEECIFFGEANFIVYFCSYDIIKKVFINLD